jgi:hypothetical protein
MVDTLQHQIFLNLHKEYCDSQNIDIESKEFLILILLFPAYLVAIADNNVDKDEKQIIGQFTFNILSEIYGGELSTDDYDRMILAYYQELKSIGENLNKWEDKFISTLTFICANSPESLGRSVIMLMEEVSASSNGQSDIEKQVIINISENIKL